MTTIGEMLGEKADLLVRETLSVGDVHLLQLGREEGITPKEGDIKDKFFVILGFDDAGGVIGGVVVNSRINPKLPSSITDYYMHLSASCNKFLSHDSFVNCSTLKTVKKEKFNKSTFRGKIEDSETINQIIGTVSGSPYISKKLLKQYGNNNHNNKQHHDNEEISRSREVPPRGCRHADAAVR